MENREAIGLIRQMIKDNEEDGGVEFGNKDKEALTLAISALEKQEADSWIPVSERPKKDGRYQVTRLDYVTDTKFIDNLWYEKNTWWNGQATGDYAVTAWRPLPEPYQEDEA